MAGTAPGGRGKRSAPPRPIGFHGRHDHGKPLDDPVYPTKHVPASLLPTFPQDWRSAGRALLCMGMAMLEGRRLRSKGAVMKWQEAAHCSTTCWQQCEKSPDRIFYAWRLAGSVHEHHNRMDALLFKFKGVNTFNNVTKPFYTPTRQVAVKNRFKSERMIWDTAESRYIFADREDIHPGFGLRPDHDESRYAEGEQTYDSDSDQEASSCDEDSDGDGRMRAHEQ
eukprot:gnl/TRDRNA2_/TRDRNA2_80421_c0_seq1.p1 gnl/TRDRNA2_/TRDRNA2_80421_c0~~gnl/TRDRNA2_/TRDRNA2_80421_c0_seq1.p1  ORF type:complete len:260 (+),score=31.19 gnl/TRDRNA2_/TRDRNA2_80421_c0_seq1:109-780(+)